MTTPRTAAGRALLGELSESPLPGAQYAHEVVWLRLDAIEAEARAAALDEARAAVVRLWAERGGGYVSYDARPEVLDAIDALQRDEG